MAFLLKAIGLSDGIPHFPYSPKSGAAEITVTTSTLTWTVRAGTASEDGKPVSIFSIPLARANDTTRELARNALKRAKSLMLPGFLRCYGGAEHQDIVYLAMEPCEPLKNVVCSSELRAKYYGEDAELYEEGVALGMKTVGGALNALHHNQLLHGNVCCESVYVTSSGFWRLFGLELVSSVQASSSSPDGLYYRYASSVLPEYRRPPELQSGAGASAGTGAAEANAIDSWGMACLAYETLAVSQTDAEAGKLDQLATKLTSSELRACRQLPRSLQSAYNNLCAANPKARLTVSRFLESSDFIASSEYVQCVSELDELSLKDPSQREALFEHLAAVVDSFPLSACTHVILQKLTESLQIGAVPSVVNPVMKIAARVQDAEEFDKHVAGVITTLFTSQDRLLRFRLLQNAECYGSRLSPKVLNERIWPLYVKGFANPTPNIREYSARALVHLAPHLSPNIMTQDAPRALSQLQQDPDGAIRTNATIALCLIANYIPAEERSRLLVVGFGRMLKDPFTPSRTAALRAFHSTLSHISVKQLAEMVLPGVAPLTTDAVGEVRGLALGLIREAATKLETNHQTMLKKEQEAKGQTDASGAGASASSPTAHHSPTPPAKGSEEGRNTSTSWGWGWVGGGSSASSPTAAAGATAKQSAAAGGDTHVTSSVHSSPRHVDAAAALAGSTSRQATKATAADPLAAQNDGWGDDDDKDGWGDEDDGDDVNVVSVVPAKKPIALASTSSSAAAHSSSPPGGSGSASPLHEGGLEGSTNSGSPPPGKGGMKLKKKGGLGAAKME